LGMHHALAALSCSGINVLADHMLVELDRVEERACLFDGLPAYLIRVRCLLEIREQGGKPRRNRILGLARLQLDIVRRPVRYDLEVDTSTLGPEECARAVQARPLEPPCSFASLRRGML
jgi:chloramphenicol 3-O phosphotransferase